MERIPLESGTIIRFSDGTAYQIEELIGQGGSALVYEAVEVGTTSCMHFAIKEIYPAEKFQRDASGEITPIDNDAFEMKSELIEMKKHILTRSARISQEAYQSIQQVLPERNIFECAELILPGDSTPSRVSNSYVLMDSLKEKGTSLQRRVDDYRRNGTAVSLDYATRIMEAVLHVYGSLHEKGFIHGDCQMNNILLLNTSQVDEGKSIVGVELIDFGCGRKLEEDGKTEVISDSLYSTDGYRAPEILNHAANFRMTPACDVWSLGFLFLNLLVEMPRWERMRRILNLSGTPFVITEYLQKNPSDKNISDTIGLNCSKAELHFANKILSCAMANNPEERYQNAGEMLLEIQALRRCINSDTAMGIDAYMLWKSSIMWTARKAGAGLVQEIPSDKMTVYGKFGDGEEEPIVELLRKLGKRQNRNLYLHAPGGAGKSFAISELFIEYLENGRKIPLYLDMEKFTKSALAQATSGNRQLNENYISHLLAEQYFEGEEDEIKQIGEQIDSLLSDSSEMIGYFLVLDNLHKVKENVYKDAIRAINTANSVFRNTWIAVLGRMESPLRGEGVNTILGRDYFEGNIEIKFEITNTVQIALLPESFVLNSVTKCRKEPLTEQDVEILKQQREPLGLPLFFNRYLEILKAHPDVNRLPNSTAELLMIYFNQLEYDVNNRDVHQILNKHLPYVAYQYMISEEGQHDIKEIEDWLHNSFGNLRYRKDYLGKFLNECMNNLSILNINDGGQIYFVHDCYLDFFAAVRIAEKTKCAIDENNISVFECINHSWSDTSNLIWISLCTMELVDGGIYRICDNSEWLDLEYRLLTENLEYSKQYALSLPYNIFRWFVSNFGDEVALQSEIKWPILGAELDDPDMQYILSAAFYGGFGVEKNKEKALFWLETAANKGLSCAEYVLGKMYYNGVLVELDMVKAVGWFSKAAEQGDSDAENALGVAYFDGCGVVEDKEKAVFWYRRAAEQEHPAAQRNLAYVYEKGEGVEADKKKAVYWYQKAAEQGDSDAENALGVAYFDGCGVVEDKEKAVFWYRRAAEQEHPAAQRNLAYAYDKGEGIEADKERAIYWYEKAAKQNDSIAQACLALAYFDGNGVCQDVEQAIRWWTKAAEQDLSIAQFFLGHVFGTGAGVTEDKETALYWYHKAAEQGYASAQNSLGYAYEHWEEIGVDKEQAVYWYRKAAEQGDAVAQCNLGYAFEHGEGVEIDKEQAVYWYRKAAEQGYASAQYNLGYAYDYGDGIEIDKEQAVYWYRKAAEQGNAVAQNNLGYAFEHGEWVKIDKEQAVYWYRKAAEQGLASAQNNLGYAFEHGEGVEIDKEQAVYWYRRAAEQSYAVAQYNLGYAYEYGEGIEIDKEQAVYWYRKAAEQGNAIAQNNLGYAYEHWEEIGVDKEQAVYWYRKAAEQGYASAQKSLGYAYDYGEGVEIDKEQAVYWYRKAAEQGNAVAQNNLGYAFEHGEGVKIDKEQAVYWYRKAAEQGLASAQNNLGYAYGYGEGVEVDKEQAVYWYREAAKRGSSAAQRSLANMLCDGIGCKQDYEEALYWFTAAWKQGDISATNNLGWMYLNGYGINAPDYSRAFSLFTEAAEQGSKVSHKHLAEMYIHGLGVPIDLNLALEHYEKAKKLGATDVDEQIEQLKKQLSEMAE